MPSIRPATERDAAAIAHVHIASWRSTYAGIVPAPFLAALDEAERTAQWRDWLTLDLPVFVAEEAGEAIGFVGGGPIREPLPGFDAELFALYLLASSQHRRTGTALLQTLAQSLRQRGLTSMIAWVLEANTSRRFYERTGAELVQSKTLEIGAAPLPAHAYGWPSLTSLVSF